MSPVLIKIARPETTADEDEQPDEFVKRKGEETVEGKLRLRAGRVSGEEKEGGRGQNGGERDKGGRPASVILYKRRPRVQDGKVRR